MFSLYNKSLTEMKIGYLTMDKLSLLWKKQGLFSESSVQYLEPSGFKVWIVNAAI